MPARPAATALQANLYRLFTIRLIVFACQVAALAYAYFIAAMRLDYGLILGIVALLGLVNGALYWRLARHAEPSQREFFVHLLIDVAGLSVLLYFTGGASNPFVSYFLVPVTIAAATLAPRYTWLLSALALGCYSLLLFVFRPLDALMPAAEVEHAEHVMPGMTPAVDSVTSAMNLHTLGMWFNFLVSAALITYFVVKMAAELRVREERIARYREDTLRNEQIVALATQAAGTAHEMGTPLGTMAVLLKEMKQERAEDAELASDLALLQRQVTACRDSLRNLVTKADLHNQRTTRVGLRAFIGELYDQWRLVRPEVSCSLAWAVAGDADADTEVDVDPTLQQALINMLNNAADASPAGIEVTLRRDAQQWQMLIRDHGKGISRDVAGQIGTRIVSTKEGGMGVALVLSQATLNRLGGNVSLHELREGGTLTEITLPLRFAEHGHE
ncbi:MAG: ATP-binding protein [Pseudomonadota bacterium]|nr:ATP-binding protein [Pseudomonadota bacterium]